jgi:hypothetical protein
LREQAVAVAANKRETKSGMGAKEKRQAAASRRARRAREGDRINHKKKGGKMYAACVTA